MSFFDDLTKQFNKQSKFIRVLEILFVISILLEIIGGKMFRI